MNEPEQEQKLTFIVMIPMEVEAANPHEALAKVPVPPGCKATGFSVTASNQPVPATMVPRVR